MSHARRSARTRGFTLGLPRSFTIAPDGGRVVFLRAAGPEDPRTGLYTLDLASGEERLVLDPAAAPPGELTPEERARRERAREQAEGVTTYATDRDTRLAATALGGVLVVADLDTGTVRELPTAGAAFDPRPDPAGGAVAYLAGGGLHVVAADGTGHRVVIDEPGVTWGAADFVAAEEMHRHRGYWWSPDGGRLAACRVDESGVPLWHLADPAHPDRTPRPHRYPAAGTSNPEVRLAILDAAGGGARVDVRWDHATFPYLAEVRWSPGHPLTLLVVDRAQQRWQVLTVDEGSGATTVVREDTDDRWLDLVAGAPAWTGDGELVAVVDRADVGQHGARCVVVGDRVVSPPGVQVDQLVAVEDATVWYVGFVDAVERHLFRTDAATGATEQVTTGPGDHDAVVRGEVAVVVDRRLDRGPRATVRRGGDAPVTVRAIAAEPDVTPRVRLLRVGPDRLPTALLLPAPAHDPGGPLPVLLSPYGGPGLGRARRVRHDRSLFLDAQWFADQGFAVVVVDNRGMPGVSPRFEKAIRSDLASLALADQVAGLEAAADLEPRLDPGRVAIRGWSFGGYLAALAVLRRPDVFAAAIAGAPVTDWHLYDTYYTERYLGLPQEQPEAYRRSSLVDADGELVDPAPLPDPARPPALLLIHGLADDNVVAAHSLRLSSALLAAGRPHDFLPLSGVTHMTPQEVVAENLLTRQLAFLRDALG